MKIEAISRFSLRNRFKSEPYRLDSIYFGREWGEVKTPVRAIVGAIDDSPESEQEARVGFSAKQIKNLGLNDFSTGNKDALALKRMVLRNTEGLTDDRLFGQVVLEFDGKEIVCDVYNAFGKLSQKDEFVRVSMKAAKVLGLEIGSKMAIDAFIESSPVK